MSPPRRSPRNSSRCRRRGTTPRWGKRAGRSRFAVVVVVVVLLWWWWSSSSSFHALKLAGKQSRQGSAAFNVLFFVRTPFENYFTRRKHMRAKFLCLLSRHFGHFWRYKKLAWPSSCRPISFFFGHGVGTGVGALGGVPGAHPHRKPGRRPLQHLDRRIPAGQQLQPVPVQGRPLVQGPRAEVGVPGTLKHLRIPSLAW